MSKRIIYIIFAITIIGLGIIYFIFLKPSGHIENKGLLVAVPAESPLIIQINEPIQFFENLNSNELMKSLKSIPEVNNVLLKAEKFMGFVQSDEQLFKLLKGTQMILSLNFSGKDDINLLTLIKLNSNNDLDITERITSKLKSDSNYTLNSRKYNKVTITEIGTANNRIYYLAEHNGILIIGEKALLVEESIRQINIDLTENHPELIPLLKTVGAQSDMQLFINHNQVDQLVAQNLSKPMRNRSALLKLFSGWTELDISLKSDRILFSGFSNGKTEGNYYGNLFLNQQSTNSKIDKILPQTTTYYLDLNFSDLSRFFTDYESFLGKRNLLLQRTDQFKKIEKLSGINIQELFTNIIDHEVSSAGIQIDQLQTQPGRIWVVECKSGSTALKQLLEFQKTYFTLQEPNIASWSVNYKIDQQTSFNIFRFPIPDLPQILFGEVFSGIAANWMTQYDNYLVFGDSVSTISKVIHSNVLGETLSRSLDYNRDKSNFNSRSNINFYCNTTNALPHASVLLNKKLSNEISSNEELRKFKSFTWQISSSGTMLYNNACMIYSSVIKSKPQTIWQSYIKSNFDFKPKFVINHSDPQNREVVLQDKENNFYLINNLGRIIWQIKLDAPILGEVQQIDYYKNGKLQYLFNTENKLYIVDRGGNFVKNFPINFRTKATNPVSVFDYENNRDYRFFVACDDRMIYAYTPDGNILNGWNLFKTDHLVHQPIQHFRVDGKDFIVASDLMKDYLLHRTGMIRVTTDQVYPHSVKNTIYFEDRTSTHEPRLVTTETNGTLHYIYFDGKHETMNIAQLSDQHYFKAENIDSDEELEYIFADGNQLIVKKNNEQLVLKKKMEQPISHLPNIYSFSKSVNKIGITINSENKIYLFNINGEPHPGFPLEGCTAFSIGFISNENSNFNLLVGSPDGYLYNYYVE